MCDVKNTDELGEDRRMEGTTFAADNAQMIATAENQPQKKV